MTALLKMVDTKGRTKSDRKESTKHRFKGSHSNESKVSSAKSALTVQTG